MRGANPIRKPVDDDGLRLDVKNIFATLQGEGPYAGHPAVFVRLGGCNLACSFCDTDFEDFSAIPLADILKRVDELAVNEAGRRTRHLAVITGGEPLRQNIAPFCASLIEHNFRVQIETNGTLFRPLPEGVDIVCSPKNTGSGYFPIRDDLLKKLSALKFIISSNDKRYDHVGDVGQESYAIPVYVQPMDEYDERRNAENFAYAAELAQRHGYRLSLQMHKILGIE